DGPTVQSHEPQVFVELDELVSGEWKETARWIKFEEDVEESQMWGKPRVASLSFHSLLELRKTIEKGAVMLDMDRDNLTDVANDVVAEMVASGQIRAEDQGNVLKVLLSKHKYERLFFSNTTNPLNRHLAPQTTFPYTLSQASFSSFFNPSYASRLNTAGNTASATLDVSEPLIGSDDVEVKIRFINFLSTTTLSPKQKGVAVSTLHPPNFPSGPSAKELKIMKKIPEGAEATAVLVGCVEYLEQPTMAFVRLAQGTNLESVVSLPIPVRFLFILLGPSKIDYNYHEIGRSISTLMADQEFHVMAYGAESRVDLLRAINEFLDDSIVLPPGQLENPDLLKNIIKYQKGLAQREKKKQIMDSEEKKMPPPEDDDPLRRSGHLFGGFIHDVKNRYPKYLSDITDALNLQCLASIIFIYFAALSPAITFGGLLGEKTDGWMGVSEMILGCCISGCVFGLLSGQPLLVVGSTGPLLVFEEAVYKFCTSSSLPFMATRVWIGVWIFVICFIVVAFEGSFLVRFVSRFTQEIFTALISLIFIFETFNKLAKTFVQHPLQATYPVPINTTGILNQYNCSYEESITNTTVGNITDAVKGKAEILNQPNTALLSTILMLGTFIIAYFLRQFKNSKFLRSSVRRTIGDFGVPIAIFAMVLLDVLIQDTYTQKLNVPKGISPTNPSLRGWFINPLGTPDNPIPIWMVFAAVLPAFLVFILIFMESHITEMILSNKERNLKKGTGFHLNLMVLGMLNIVVSFLGMPWVCCAAVRSITHTNRWLRSIARHKLLVNKPKIEGLKEQRVTVFVVNACLGLSILMQPVLSEIPLAVLFGIFLYMGVTSLAGVQFIDRIEMLFMPAKHYPDFSFVHMVRHKKIHVFTIIQIICLAVLWVVKSTAAQIAFPFFLVLTIPLRYFVLPKFFSKKEM
uniref:Anion exchange protein n=1 Tax=Ciona savignyi TaxID=51511 RepID=H2ZCT0_CIOSA